jgi:acetyl esterase
MRTDDPRAGVDPQVAALFEMMRAGKESRVLEASALRAGFEALVPLLVAGAPEVAGEEEIRIPGPAGDVRALLFRPAAPAAEPPPILVYAHGGGWVIMSPESHAKLAKSLGAGCGALVVSLDYRLAPEYAYPTPLDDVVAAFRWVRDHAAELGGDPARCALAGDSAGGNLTAAVTLRLLANAEPPPRCALLICPVTDVRLDTASFHRLAPEDPVLDEAIMHFFRDSYVTREQWEDPFVSPLLGSLEGFPPACIVAGELDPLCDDALAFADRLRAAGTQVTLHHHPGQPHDFPLFPGIDAGERALAEMAAFLRERL